MAGTQAQTYAKNKAPAQQTGNVRIQHTKLTKTQTAAGAAKPSANTAAAMAHANQHPAQTNAHTKASTDATEKPSKNASKTPALNGKPWKNAGTPAMKQVQNATTAAKETLT